MVCPEVIICDFVTPDTNSPEPQILGMKTKGTLSLVLSGNFE